MTAASHPRQKMRHVARVLNSNVDKKSYPHEFPVRLCNYTDVYRHSRIHAGMDFMRATATETEMGRFLLRSGDVVITKDSEDWADIGVPALVVSESPDLLCGYHLTILRPFQNVILGGFLAATLQTPEIAAQLHASATGVTRYGLSLNAIRSIAVPTPSIDEQRLIVRYLDHAELRVARAVAAKSAVLGGLNEARGAVIADAVLGVEDGQVLHAGLGYLVPHAWSVEPFWSVAPEASVSGVSGKELLSVFLDRGVIRYSDSSGQVHKPSTDLSKYQLVLPGDLVLNNQQAWRGSVGVSRFEGIVSPAYIVCRLSDRLDDDYANFLFRSPAMVDQFVLSSRGVGSIQRQVHRQSLRNVRVPIPPLEEQRQLASRLMARTQGIDAAIEAVRGEIALLKEYRIRLISDVVTGKMDVTNEAAELPDIDPVELAEALAGVTAGSSDEVEDEDGGEDEDE